MIEEDIVDESLCSSNHVRVVVLLDGFGEHEFAHPFDALAAGGDCEVVAAGFVKDFSRYAGGAALRVHVHLWLSLCLCLGLRMSPFWGQGECELWLGCARRRGRGGGGKGEFFECGV